MKTVIEHLEEKWLLKCENNFKILLYPDEAKWLNQINLPASISSEIDIAPLRENFLIDDIRKGYDYPESNILYVYYDLVAISSHHNAPSQTLKRPIEENNEYINITPMKQSFQNAGIYQKPNKDAQDFIDIFKSNSIMPEEKDNIHLEFQNPYEHSIVKNDPMHSIQHSQPFFQFNENSRTNFEFGIKNNIHSHTNTKPQRSNSKRDSIQKIYEMIDKVELTKNASSNVNTTFSNEEMSETSIPKVVNVKRKI